MTPGADENEKAMSSAYIAICVFFDFSMSLICTMKRKGHSMEPCGTRAST